MDELVKLTELEIWGVSAVSAPAHLADGWAVAKSRASKQKQSEIFQLDLGEGDNGIRGTWYIAESFLDSLRERFGDAGVEAHIRSTMGALGVGVPPSSPTRALKNAAGGNPTHQPATPAAPTSTSGAAQASSSVPARPEGGLLKDHKGQLRDERGRWRQSRFRRVVNAASRHPNLPEFQFFR